MRRRKLFRGLAIIFMGLIFLSVPRAACAQTETFPFWFDLIPTLADGRITVRIDISNRADWRIDDVTITVPIPPGTRFDAAQVLPVNRVSVTDGAVTIRLADVYNYAGGNSFTLAITDPHQTVFPLSATVHWNGERPGSETIALQPFDITRAPLGWQPAAPRLQLQAKAVTTADGTLTLSIFPKATDKNFRMWDVRISVPVPDGLTFVSADAPQPFSAGFDGQTVVFSAIELPRLVDFPPLAATFTLKKPAATIAARIWAQWTNGPRDPVHLGNFSVQYVDTGVSEPLPPATEMFALDATIAAPNIPQLTVFDRTGDVPFAPYDLQAVSFYQYENGTKLVFRTAENPAASVEFSLYIDGDCDPNTGAAVHGLGAEYRLNFPAHATRATIVPWHAAAGDWDWDAGAEQSAGVQENVVTIAFPYNAVSAGQPFCWVVSGKDTTTDYFPDPPLDWIPDEAAPDLSRYQLAPPMFSGAQGKIAVPLFNSAGFYDVYLFGAFSGAGLAQITYARQPNFAADGRTLLVNHQQFSAQNRFSYTFFDGRRVTFVFKNFNAAEKIFEYSVARKTETLASVDARDAFPFYNPQGTEFVFSSVAPAGATSDAPFLAIRPAGTPPEPDGASYRVLASQAAPDGVRGHFPVWTDGGAIAFNPCLPSSLRVDCGIYALDAAADTASAHPAAAVQLTTGASDIPADAGGGRIAFSSRRNGDWEAYVMRNDGSAVKNLSNAPAATDGLPTFSPDGRWVAFVSDRDGAWAVWVVPVTGGEPQKLFALPDKDPWGTGDLAWYFERMSWSP